MAYSSGPSLLCEPELTMRAGAIVPTAVSGRSGIMGTNDAQRARCSGVTSAAGSASSFSKSVIIPEIVGESSAQQLLHA